jgi:small subunit ribosomal protein S6
VREYEFTFIVQPEISDEGLQAICSKLEGVLEKHGSRKLYYDDWGRRRLAYEIQKFQKGHYMLLYFLDDGRVVPELERAARIDDSVLRFLTVMTNDRVVDLEARMAEATALDEERKRKAAERAEREAEEAAAREAEAAKAAESKQDAGEEASAVAEDGDLAADDEPEDGEEEE